MPIYEYQCDKCEQKHEALRKISDEPLTLCPACGKEGLRKLVSAAAFRLSGSGWYETDFKDKKQQKNVSDSDNKPQPVADGKKANGGDSKPATTTASSSGSAGTATAASSKSSSASTD